MTSRPTIQVLFAGAPPSPLPRLPGVALEAHGALEPARTEAAVRGAGVWPEAGEAVAGHEARVSISLAEAPGSEIARALVLSRAAAELAGMPGARAVLWDPTTLLHAPDAWRAQLEDASEEDVPLLLWVAFDGEETSEGAHALRTRGLAQFGALEVEVEGSRRDGEEVLEIVMDVALVALDRGAAGIEDGEAVEVSREKIRVRVAPSLRGDGTRAYRLRLP